MASDIALAVDDGARASAEVSQGTDPRPPDSVSSRTDPLTAIGIQTLSEAIEMLREDLGTANRRIDELLHELADARTAEMISGSEAAALRTRPELLTDERHRPWWRRWFRGRP